MSMALDSAFNKGDASTNPLANFEDSEASASIKGEATISIPASETRPASKNELSAGSQEFAMSIYEFYRGLAMTAGQGDAFLYFLQEQRRTLR